MTQKQTKEIITYRKKTAQHDFETMMALFRVKRYSDCLFFGHIVLEKILKAHVVKTTQTQAPYTHDLARLKELAKISISDEEYKLLELVNDFNIRARYPEQKLRFYKKCTKTYTEKNLNHIVPLYKKLCQKLILKK